MSPTITTPAMTQAGVILGTAAYMSPEQAQGQARRQARDIWAFGVVLYEMLTGRRAFEGEDVSDTLARILMKTSRTGRRCRRALPRRSADSFAALPREGSQATPGFSARMRALEIEEAFDDRRAADRRSCAVAATDSRLPARWHARCRGLFAAIFGAALVSALVLWAPWRSATRAQRRASCSPASAPTRRCRSASGASAILSPDGTTLAFVAQQAGLARLFVRKLDQLQATALAGTEGAASPFFSPDGQWIAFFAGGKLKKDLGHRRRRDHAVRRAGGPRRHVEPTTTRSSSRRRTRQRHADARLGGRRDAGGRSARSAAGADDAAVAAGAPAAARPCSTPSTRRRRAAGRCQPRRRAAVGRDAEDCRPRRLTTAGTCRAGI